MWHVLNEMIVSTLDSGPGIFVPKFSLCYSCWSSAGFPTEAKILVHKHVNPSF